MKQVHPQMQGKKKKSKDKNKKNDTKKMRYAAQFVRTETNKNRHRKKAQSEVLDNKNRILTVPHGTARKIRREAEREAKRKEIEKLMQAEVKRKEGLGLDLRKTYQELGWIKPREQVQQEKFQAWVARDVG